MTHTRKKAAPGPILSSTIKGFLLIISFGLLTACNPEEKRLRNDPLHLLFERHEEKQLKCHQMILVAAGVPEEEEIRHFALHYVAFRKMKLPEVRRLVVDSVEQFLEMVNSDAKMQEKLKNPPVTYRDINFNVGFGKIDGDFQAPPYIAYAHLDHGIVYYCYEDYLFRNFIDEENVEEPYERAKEIVNAGLPENEESD